MEPTLDNIMINYSMEVDPVGQLWSASNTTVTIVTNQRLFIKQLDFYLSGIVLLIICVLGLISNALVIFILTRKSMKKTSTNCFLLALAVFDSIVLICTPFMICFKPLSEIYKGLIYAYIVAYIYPLALIAQTCTIWITVSFTVERYIAVKHPLKAMNMCTTRRARVTTTSVVLLSIIYNFSRWFEYKAEVEKYANNTIIIIPETNLPSYQPVPTELQQNKMYESVYFSVLYLAVICIIPVFILTILNYCLIQAVRKSVMERKAMGSCTNNSKAKENNITTMLVSVVAVFIICQMPALLYNVAYGIDRKTVTDRVGWQILSIVRNFMVTLNSAVNFILYCAFGQKFRNVFLKIFWKKWSKNRRGTVSERRTQSSTNGTMSVHIPMLDRNSNTKITDTCIKMEDGDMQL